LQEFCHDLAASRNVGEFFTNRVDLDRYVNYLAATALVQNWDSYNKNHCLVYDGQGSKKWFPLPWDLDRTLGDHWNNSFTEARLPVLLGTRSQPGITGWNRMAERFFSDPGLRLRFAKRLEELLKTEFTPEKLFPVLDQLEATIGLAPGLARQRYAGGIRDLKQFINQRRAFLLQELPSLRR
jgi:spore coat protein CotH